jgi:UDP-N-acetylglucosamine:LPS N-acetylglucosamine transferase
MVETAPSAVVALLSDPARLETMREHACRVGKPNAALDIADFVLTHG